MAEFILHHNGAYNIYNTVSDTARFEQAMTLEQFRAWYVRGYGEKSVCELGGFGLEDRLARAHATGSSAYDEDLEETICANRAGENESRLSVLQFIDRFLTLPVAAGPTETVIDLDADTWEAIKKAASESSWIPPDYFMNDWASDVCKFLREGHPSSDALTIQSFLNAPPAQMSGPLGMQPVNSEGMRLYVDEVVKLRRELALREEAMEWLLHNGIVRAIRPKTRENAYLNCNTWDDELVPEKFAAVLPPTY